MLLGKALKTYEPLLDSVLPGGSKWWRASGDCLETCPYFRRCKGWGPSQRLCSDSWKFTPATRDATRVLAHVFQHFDYYDRGDYSGDDRVTRILASELMTIFTLVDCDDLKPSEVRRIVKARLLQAEFKSKLFALWDGCSLNGIPFSDEHLVASHILPWASCEKKSERVDEYNGFLLPPNYDYVFDRHLISFDEQGQLQSIPALDDLYATLGIDTKARIFLKERNQGYLEYHRKGFQEKSAVLMARKAGIHPT